MASRGGSTAIPLGPPSFGRGKRSVKRREATAPRVLSPPSEGRGSRVARGDGFTWRINSHPPRSPFLWKGEEEREASAHGDIHRAQSRSYENPGSADLRWVKRA